MLQNRFTALPRPVNWNNGDLLLRGGEGFREVKVRREDKSKKGDRREERRGT